MKAIVKNMRNDDGRTIMYCPQCASEYSANKSDYFWAGGNEKFICCGETMELVTKQIKYKRIKKGGD